MSFESFIDRQIREAAEKGAFENLPGAGEPLPDLDDADPARWVKKKLAAENLSLPLPPGLQLRKDVRGKLGAIRMLKSEAAVRKALVQLNQVIAKANSTHIDGPAPNLGPVDVEAFVDRWREGGAG